LQNHAAKGVDTGKQVIDKLARIESQQLRLFLVKVKDITRITLRKNIFKKRKISLISLIY